MINVTIDDKKIEVPEGTTVLRAAEMAGIDIPTLCDHPNLTPYGGCRLCLVEVEGARTLQPSCTLPVNNNMVVHTNTDKVKEARKFVLTLIFSERNHFCPYCQVSGGDCELQNAAYGEGMTHWPIQPHYQPYEVDASHPYFVLENNRCILCRRCVRACAELVGNFTLGFEERGSKSTLVADLGVPLGESSCISCGVCLQVCPTGALIDRWSAYRGHDTDITRDSTLCVGCSVGCGVDLLYRDNSLIRIEGTWKAPVNEGVLCKVGRFEPMEQNKERLVTPLVRKNGSLKAATWDEAIEVIAEKLKPMSGKTTDGVAAALVSTRLPAEVLHMTKQVFEDGMKSAMVTSSEEGLETNLPAGYADKSGKPFECNIEAIKTADCVLTIGTNLVDEHQVLGFFVKRNLPKGTSLIVADPSSNPLDELADCTLKASSEGNEKEIVDGLMAALEKLGLAKGGNSAQASAALKTAAEKTGIASDNFLKAAHLLGSSQNPVVIYGKGLMMQTSETLDALLKLTDNIASVKENHPRIISVKGQANSLAAMQYHLDKTFKPDGYQAAYIVLGDDEPSKRLVQSLEKASFVVVQASHVSKLTAIADVVLPVENWTEQEGHYINLEGRIQKAHKIITAPEGVLANVDVLKNLATKLGIKTNEDWQTSLKKRNSSVAIS